MRLPPLRSFLNKKLVSLFGFTLLFPKSVSAHAFGQLYNLPIPFWMYLYGGAVAIVVSFLIIGYFTSKSTKTSFPKKELLNNFSKFITNNNFLNAAKLISVGLFFLTVISGFIGVNNAYLNFNMTFFWIVFLLGMTYTTAIVGNIYSIINPWKGLVEWFEKSQGSSIKGFVKYPKSLAYYPAFLFYFLFIWIELNGQTTPFTLSLVLFVYTLINILSVSIFGKDAWFKYGEFFSVFFNLISKISPFKYEDGKIFLRPPFVGLLEESCSHFSLLLFILFMLSSTAFDGFRETLPWVRFIWTYINQPQGITTIVGLLLSPVIFLILYLLLIAIAKQVTKSSLSVLELTLRFAYSLIPIALVYNAAHYYTLILSEGQRFFSLISDPFGFGWDLFGTTNFYPDLSIIDANFTWHSQVGLILLGHIAGVYLAHMIALKIFPSRKLALLSQLPMLILMVVYTVIGLWILSQPITSDF